MFYFIADTHFGHQNIKEYFNRPENFEALILKNLELYCPNNVVLVHLGDFALCEIDYWHKEFFKITKNKNIKTWLIRGNHDRETNTYYLTQGWDFVGDKVIFGYNGYDVVLTHKPIEVNVGEINIHGHLHNLGQDDKNHKLVYLEHKYEPIALKKLIGGK